MAIVDYINLGYDLQIVVADADPRSSGVDVPKGSLVLLNDGTGSFFKFGTVATDWSLSILGATTTANYISKFTATGIVGNSTIQDDGTTVSFSSNVSAAAFFGAVGVYLSVGTTWAGVSQDSQINFQFTPTTYTIGNSLSAVSVSFTSRTLTVGSTGSHNMVSQVAIPEITVNSGTGATVTNAATLYIRGAAIGTATITNNYALWVNNGVTRLDGTALINAENSVGGTVLSAITAQRTTTGTPAIGIGSAIDFSAETAVSTIKNGGRIQSISTNITGGSEAFDMVFNTLTGSVLLNERLRILSTGQLRFNAYTSASSFGGTAVAALLTTSAGNIITQSPVMQVTSLTISAASVTGAFTTPITLVAAQGAGTVIVPSVFIFKLDSAGTAFATNTNYQFQIGTTAIGASRSFAGTTDVFTVEPITALVATGVATLQNQALVWKVLVGNPTGGTGATISIGCIYTVMTI